MHTERRRLLYLRFRKACNHLVWICSWHHSNRQWRRVYPYEKTKRIHPFDSLCAELHITHKLIRPRTPCTMAKWSVVTATIRNDSTITLVFTPTKICKSRWSGICIAPITFRWLFLDGNLPIKSSGKWKPLDFSDFSRATPSLRQKNQFSIDKTLSLFPVSHHWQTNNHKYCVSVQ